MNRVSDMTTLNIHWILILSGAKACTERSRMWTSQENIDHTRREKARAANVRSLAPKAFGLGMTALQVGCYV